MGSDRIVTFTSDFGTNEYYVGAVKGAIHSVHPDLRIIDISHDIPSHDILTGAFVLAGGYSAFPSGTIHLVVVDPGVGSDRRAIVAETQNYLFVAPDNGVLSLIYKKESVSRVIAVDAEHYYRTPVSPTFHARDIFGPVAAWAAKGIEISKFGSPIRDYRRMKLPPVKDVGDGTLEGFVLHIDKFGNIVTSFSREGLREYGVNSETSFEVEVGSREVSKQVTYYSEGEEGELFCLFGSSDYLEIAALKKPANRALDVKRGTRVVLRIT